MTPTKLYRHFAKDGTLLYVGVTAEGWKRQVRHLRNSKWADQIARVDLESHPTRASASAAEREAITREKPLYNINLNRGSEYRSTKSTSMSMRLPNPLLQAIDRVAFEEKINRSQAMIALIEDALAAREDE